MIEAEYPLSEDKSTSALRFTWTYKNPLYYQESAKEAGEEGCSDNHGHY